MKTIIITVAGFAATANIVVLIDYFRLRLKRNASCDTCAQLAAEALAGDVVDGIRMPEPNDPRWAPVDIIVMLQSGKESKMKAIALGDVRVCLGNDPTVFFGNGPGVNGGGYAARVVRAYRQRLADNARGTS